MRANPSDRGPALVLWWWLALFGIWPLAHPEHTTLANPVTWIDLALHLVAFTVVGPLIARWSRRQLTRITNGAT